MPNFLIIGAGKSGTTALYRYLKQHPQIYMSPVKEPNFFAFEGEKVDLRGPGDQKLINYYSVNNIEAYRALFKGVLNETAIGEASPLYLYSPRVPERIRHYLPDAKLIAILRDPVERAYSSYLMHVREGWETLTDFAQALREEETRIHNNWGWRRYVSTGFYYAQLKRYFNTFSQSQIKVYLYEDFKVDAVGLLRDIFQFLGVDETFVPNMSIRYNASGLPKNKVLHSLVTRVHSTITARPINTVLKLLLPAGLKTNLIYGYENLRAQCFQYNLVRPQLSSEVRKQLIEVYREDILKLQALIQQDVSKWLE
jgi:hypothetical protein